MADLLDLTAAVLTDDTQNLVARVKGGDTAAFRLIFEHHQRLVLRFLYGMVGEYDLAEELAQETFMRAYKNINTLRDETKLATWLCGIAKNVVFNYFRARRSAVHTIEINEQTTGIVRGKEISPDLKVLNSELNQVIQNALKKLDDDKRMVFTLKMLQQMSYEEIAEVTGFSIPKLKTDLHRAKAEMRILIRPYMETGYEL